MSESHDERLGAALRELRAALDESGAVDAKLEAPLRTVLGEIDDLLERAEHEAGSHAAISERVEELALEFEVAHPLIAGVLNRMTHLLASMGI